MCGRASQYSEFREIKRGFGPLVSGPDAKPPARYNAAPRQTLLTVRHDRQAGGRIVESMRWGLIPSWAKDAKIGDRSINARDIGQDGRGLDERPMFRDAWQGGQRCLVPLNSFFEWKTVGKGKQPYAVGATDGTLLGVAGLWEPWRDPAGGPLVRSFTIITTAANQTLAPIHDRMPVIIAPADFEAWLAGDQAVARALLRPCPVGRLRLWRVSPRINKVGEIEGPACIEPLASRPAQEPATSPAEST